ncbi:hypothetical protein CBW16_04290 [Flavobacteriaceae bacterium JJC]|nr:hypothetical protein CBW16_04290 [Flavobacteriaceae bacterium JJC]
MKKIIYLGAIVALSANFSCKKSTEGNKSVIVTESQEKELKTENGKTDSSYSSSTVIKDEKGINEEHTDRYVAEDGSSALVTFKNTGKENTISIRSNNKTISAPRKAEKGEGVYGNYDFEIVSKNDSITITQGNNIIRLKKARK